MKIISKIYIALSLVLIFALLSDKTSKPDYMLSEYQETYYIFMKNNPECATKFSNIMDSLNTKK